MKVSTTLVSMSGEVFETFAAEANEAYAQDPILAGTWSREEALAKVINQFNQLLPQGFETPNHHFYEVRNDVNRTVGTVWFAIVGDGTALTGYLCSIRTNPDQQRQGYGRAALRVLESIAAELRLTAIRLNVFGHNPGVQALYRSMGYEVTSSTMRKVVSQ